MPRRRLTTCSIFKAHGWIFRSRPEAAVLHDGRMLIVFGIATPEQRFDPVI
jgi:hypothetical protein